MAPSSVEALNVELGYLKEAIKELKEEIKAYRSEITELNRHVIEARVGRRWLFGLLSASVMLGTLIDTLLKWAKVY